MLLSMLPMLAMAQTTNEATLNITVANGGELEQQIKEEDRLKINSLTISGPLNGKDFKLLQDIVNRSKANEKKGERLVEVLDLSGVTILEGKEGMKLKANTLPDNCFAGAKGLVSITLPSSVVNISKNCFDGCTTLAVVNYPATVTTIESGAFKGCESLKTIALHQNINELPSTTSSA